MGLVIGRFRRRGEREAPGRCPGPHQGAPPLGTPPTAPPLAGPRDRAAKSGPIPRAYRLIGANGASFIRLLRCAIRYPASAFFRMNTCQSGSACIAARFVARSAASL